MRNSLSSESDLWVFSDGPKTGPDSPNVEAVRNYVQELSNGRNFNSVRISKSDNNQGLAASVIAGVSSVLEHHRQVIVLEDDLVVAPDFLDYMNDALNYFEAHSVGAISGYTPIAQLPVEYTESVYTSVRSSSQGWATWRDRWEDVDWGLTKFDEFI